MNNWPPQTRAQTSKPASGLDAAFVAAGIRVNQHYAQAELKRVGMNPAKNAGTLENNR